MSRGCWMVGEMVVEQLGKFGNFATLFLSRDEGGELGDLAVGRLALEVAHKRDIARADFVEHRAAVFCVDVADLRRGTCDAERESQLRLCRRLSHTPKSRS